MDKTYERWYSIDIDIKYRMDNDPEMEKEVVYEVRATSKIEALEKIIAKLKKE